MKRVRVWIIGLGLTGVIVGMLISKGQLLNGFFSTMKLQFLTSYSDANYLYEINEEAGLESIYSGYLRGVGNSTTYYLSSDDLRAEFIAHQGDYYGTGLELAWALDGHALTVVDIIQGSKADEAGLLPGDRIIEVAGVPVLPANQYTLFKCITSHVEEETSYVISRQGKEWTTWLEPSWVRLEDIEGQWFDDILYVKLNSVKEGTSQRIQNLLDSVERDRYEGLILDLRNLTAYNIDEVAQISNLFLKEGIAFKLRTKVEGIKTYEMSETSYDMPMILLTNGGTLAGAEALVLALKERAQVIGSNTGGEIYIGKLIQFDDGTGMSIAYGQICDRYGNELTEKGILPDLRLYLPEEELIEKLENGYTQQSEDYFLQHALTLF